MPHMRLFVPDEVHRVLRVAAAVRGVSLAETVVLVLREALGAGEEKVAAERRAIEAVRVAAVKPAPLVFLDEVEPSPGARADAWERPLPKVAAEVRVPEGKVSPHADLGEWQPRGDFSKAAQSGRAAKPKAAERPAPSRVPTPPRAPAEPFNPHAVRRPAFQLPSDLRREPVVASGVESPASDGWLNELEHPLRVRPTPEEIAEGAPAAAAVRERVRQRRRKKA